MALPWSRPSGRDPALVGASLGLWRPMTAGPARTIPMPVIWEASTRERRRARVVLDRGFNEPVASRADLLDDDDGTAGLGAARSCCTRIRRALEMVVDALDRLVVVV